MNKQIFQFVSIVIRFAANVVTDNMRYWLT